MAVVWPCGVVSQYRIRERQRSAEAVLMPTQVPGFLRGAGTDLSGVTEMRCSGSSRIALTSSEPVTSAKVSAPRPCDRPQETPIRALE